MTQSNLKWPALVAIMVLWVAANAMVSDGLRYCRDGTVTYSSGSGACSWHDGQGQQPEKKLVRYLALITLFAWYVWFYRRKAGSQPAQVAFPQLADNRGPNYLEGPKDGAIYRQQFNGYAAGVADGIIVELLLRFDAINSDAAVDAICNQFHRTPAEATAIVAAAVVKKIDIIGPIIGRAG